MILYLLDLDSVGLPVFWALTACYRAIGDARIRRLSLRRERLHSPRVRVSLEASDSVFGLQGEWLNDGG